MIIYSENIYTPEGVRKGYIEIEGKIIRNICTDENELKNKSDQVVNTRVLRSPSNLLTIKLLRKRTWIFRSFSGRKQADMTLFNR